MKKKQLEDKVDIEDIFSRSIEEHKIPYTPFCEYLYRCNHRIDRNKPNSCLDYNQCEYYKTMEVV